MPPQADLINININLNLLLRMLYRVEVSLINKGNLELFAIRTNNLFTISKQSITTSHRKPLRNQELNA